MSFRIISSRVIVPLAVALAAGPAGAAGLFRAYLDPSGSDANPCTLQLPCRLLPAALAAVTDGGEIWMLDSANYNTAQVNVAKSVTILAVPGALGSVVAAGGNAINVATPGAKVVLRNLVIVPLPGGGGANGIHVSAAGSSLAVDGTLVANHVGSGIVVDASATLRLIDTVVRDNAGDGLALSGGASATLTRATVSGNSQAGIVASGTLAGVATTFDVGDSTVDGNAHGVVAKSVDATASVRGSVRASRVVRNAGAGASAESSAGAPVTLSVSASIVSNNGSGLAALAGGRIWAAGNTVSDNGIGLNNTGGTLESAGNNAVRNNYTSNTSGAVISITPM